MRCWVGKEVEGDCRSTTLFVESKRLTTDIFKHVAQYARKHGVNRVYFGAGRVDVESVQNDFSPLLDADLRIVVETTIGHAQTAALFPANTVIVLRFESRVSTKCLNGREITLKVDDFAQVGCAKGVIWNSLEGLKNGLYENDKEVEI